jgi:CheY-like chemotaxis protein
VRILFVEHHNAFRQAASIAMDLEPDLEVVHQAASAAEGREKMAQGGVDAALVDIPLPDVGAEELVRDLRGANPSVPVLVLATIEEREVHDPGHRGPRLHGAVGPVGALGPGGPRRLEAQARRWRRGPARPERRRRREEGHRPRLRGRRQHRGPYRRRPRRRQGARRPRRLRGHPRQEGPLRALAVPASAVVSADGGSGPVLPRLGPSSSCPYSFTALAREWPSRKACFRHSAFSGTRQGYRQRRSPRLVYRGLLQIFGCPCLTRRH